MKALNASDYHVGWICALSLELAAAKAMLDEQHESLSYSDQSSRDTNTYVLGEISGHNVVIACLPAGVYGTNAAATVAINMLRTFQNLRFGFMVGIGGGIPGKVDIRLGDVVISQPNGVHGGVVQYDRGKSKHDQTFERTGTLNPPPDPLLTALAAMQADHEGRGSKISQYLQVMRTRSPNLAENGYQFPFGVKDQLYCNHSTTEPTSCVRCRDGKVIRRERGHNRPELHYGTIASGNQVIKNTKLRDAIGRELGAICVEMEAAGLMNTFPCLVIRGICDYADSRKNDVWQRYSATTAAAAAKELLGHVSIASTKRQDRIVQHVDVAKWQRDLDERTCLHALNTSLYEEYKDVNPPRTEGTCLWVLQHPRYRKWSRSRRDDLLWISADPGCGKSVLAKSLVDREHWTSRGHTTCYFFFKDNQGQDSLPTALCALLHQLFRQHRNMLKHAVRAWRLLGDSLLRDTKELWRIFMRAARDLNTTNVTCILDALDECNDNDSKVLISLLNDFYRDTHTQTTRQGSPEGATIKFLVTSRPYDNIQSRFSEIPPELPTIRLRGEDESESIHSEIDIVIRHRVDELARNLSLDNRTRKKLEKRLLSMQHRTYLWLHLTFDEIKSAYEHTLRLDEVTIETLPVSVEDAYEKILNKVDSRRAGTVKTILTIIVGAGRSLTIGEMAIALGLATSDFDEPPKRAILDPDWVEERIRNWCGLFISFHQDRIYLIHQTAKEFLVARRASSASHKIWKSCLYLPDVETAMADVCAKFLHLQRMIDEREVDFAGLPRGGAGLKTDMDTFFEYSTDHWASHLSQSSVPKDDVIVKRMSALHRDTSSRFFHRWFQLILNKEWSYISYPLINELHAVAMTGSVYVLSRVLKTMKCDVNCKDVFGNTPLMWAARHGHLNAAKALLKAGAHVNQVGRTKLPDTSMTVRYDGRDEEYHALVKFKLSAQGGSDIYINHDTSLHIAVANGHIELTEMLIRRGADINSSNKAGETPLFVAVERGYRDIAKMLVEYKAKVNLTDNGHRSPLHVAAEGGYSMIVEDLIDRGAEVNKRSLVDQTPLHRACYHGQVAIVRTLLRHGAKTDTFDVDRTTLLHLAAYEGHEDILLILLKTKCKLLINEEDNEGETALHMAYSQYHSRIVQILLDHGADASIRDSRNRVPRDRGPPSTGPRYLRS